MDVGAGKDSEAGEEKEEAVMAKKTKQSHAEPLTAASLRREDRSKEQSRAAKEPEIPAVDYRRYKKLDAYRWSSDGKRRTFAALVAAYVEARDKEKAGALRKDDLGTEIKMAMEAAGLNEDMPVSVDDMFRTKLSKRAGRKTLSAKRLVEEGVPVETVEKCYEEGKGGMSISISEMVNKGEEI